MTETIKSTTDQRRAAFALKQIRDLQELGENKYGHYVSYVSALPATIVMNGLGQALTTLLAKAKGKRSDPHRLLFDHVAGWLNQQVMDLRVPNPDDLTQVIDRLMEQNEAIYVRAQAEAMVYLNWLKQFARAYLTEKEGYGD